MSIRQITTYTKTLPIPSYSGAGGKIAYSVAPPAKLDLEHSTIAVFVSKGYKIRGRAIDASCHGHVDQIEMVDSYTFRRACAFAFYGIDIYTSLRGLFVC
eukprot:6172297-Pleurochrysis_carterae.AAC.3